ncbi:hypothetical protein AJ80_09844 [Polytolypa hystricis UAMH7299]|uniref:Uncharacterized protein n=1 Tax=Polytolypa hystricis (strain UAMH7299) TaxID=1447883 RepID=A0A2B7WI60_POLH7|nr:hypothetical protein AJ80_09844 [Polytolypa hystricis UAMH7299]
MKVGRYPSRSKFSLTSSSRIDNTKSRHLDLIEKNQYPPPPPPTHLIPRDAMEIPEPIQLDEESKEELERLVENPDYSGIIRKPGPPGSQILKVHGSHVEKIKKQLGLQGVLGILFRHDEPGRMGNPKATIIRVTFTDNPRPVSIAHDSKSPQRAFQFDHAYKVPRMAWTTDEVYLLALY